MEQDRPDIEIEISHPIDKKKLFVIISGDEKIWVDIKYLPDTIFLCATFDGELMCYANVGEEGKGEERPFIGIDWIINEWGGDPEIVKAAKKRREKTLKELPELKKKYW